MKLSTWMADEGALDYLAHAGPPAPKSRSRPKAPARPMPWRKVAKLGALAHAPLVAATVALEVAHLGAEKGPVLVAAWTFVVSALVAAVAPALVTLVFALVVFSVRRR